ncbi:MAG: hypothetical protein ACFBSD_00235 [Paracoccaceae bacterium]
MEWLVWIGIAMVAIGLAGLAHCVRTALRLRRDPPAPEALKAEMHRLMARNAGAVGTAFFGLALMLLGALL